MSMTIVQIKDVDETMHVTNAGPTIVSKFKVLFTGTYSTAFIYQNATAMGLIDYGDYVTGTSSELYCSNIDAEITTNANYIGTTAAPGVFTYTATFSTITTERLDLSPLSRPAQITGGGIELSEVRRVDVTGAALVNSAGDYYEGLPEFYIPGSEIQVSWNVASNPLTMCQTYSFSTNQTAIWGQAAYSGVAGKISAEQSFETFQGVLVEFWKVTVPMRFRNDGRGWNFQPFDYGYRYLSSGAPEAYVDPTNGAPAPIFLDGKGNLLGGDGTTNNADAVIFPASSGSTPAGYKTLTSQDWAGMSCPVNPFTA